MNRGTLGEPMVEERVGCLEGDVGEIEVDIRRLHTELGDIEKGLRADMTALDESLCADMNAPDRNLRADTKEMDTSVRTELKDVTGR